MYIFWIFLWVIFTFSSFIVHRFLLFIETRKKSSVKCKFILYYFGGFSRFSMSTFFGWLRDIPIVILSNRQRYSTNINNLSPRSRQLKCVCIWFKTSNWNNIWARIIIKKDEKLGRKSYDWKFSQDCIKCCSSVSELSEWTEWVGLSMEQVSIVEKFKNNIQTFRLHFLVEKLFIVINFKLFLTPAPASHSNIVIYIFPISFSRISFLLIHKIIGKVNGIEWKRKKRGNARQIEKREKVRSTIINLSIFDILIIRISFSFSKWEWMNVSESEIFREYSNKGRSWLLLPTEHTKLTRDWTQRTREKRQK